MKPIKKPSVLLSMLGLTIVVLTIVHVIVANMISTTGVDLEAIQTDLRSYKKENVILREKVLEQSSLLSIASQAASMGFVKSETPLVMSSQLPIAKR